MSSQQPEKENPSKTTTKSATDEKQESLVEKLGKRYTNLKQVIQADQIPADSEDLNKNPFEGYRSGLTLKPPKKRVDVEVLTELGKQEEQRLNKLSENYFQKINGYLERDVSDARQWNCPEAEPGDWDNVPEIAVQIMDYLSKHGKVVADHLYKLSQEETTAQLRHYTELKLKEAENELQSQKNYSSTKLDELNKTSLDQFAQFKQFSNNALSLRNNYLKDQPSQKLESLVTCRSGIKDCELADDNTSEDDVLQAENYNEPRMFTLEQLIQLINIKIAKSKLRKELTTNNQDTAELLRRVSELEDWRFKFENQAAIDLEMIGQRLTQNENTHKEFKALCEGKFKKAKIHSEAFEKHKQKTSEEFSKLNYKNIDQDNIIEGLNKQQMLSLTMLTNKIDENQTTSLSRFKSLDEFILLQFAKTNKDFERLKQDCLGMIDKQTDRLNQVITTDLQNVRQTYDKAVDGLDEIFSKLNTLFKEKIFKMKSKVAEIFAQSEIRFNQLNEEIHGLSKMLQVWQTTHKNPAVSFDAKLFSIQVKQDEIEKENKAQQAQVKDVLDKLLLALQSKEEPEPSNTTNPHRSEFNFPRNTSQKDTNQLAIKIFDGVGNNDQSSDLLPSLNSTKHIFMQTHDSLQLQSDEGTDGGVRFNHQLKFVRNLERLRARLNLQEYHSTEAFTNSTLKASKFLHLPSTTMLKSESNLKMDEKSTNSQLLRKQLQMLSPRSPIQLNTQSNMNLGSMLVVEQPLFSQKQSTLQLFKATMQQQPQNQESVSKPSSVLKDKILESDKQINTFESYIKRQQNQFQEKLKRRSQSIRPVMRSEIKEEPLVYQ